MTGNTNGGKSVYLSLLKHALGTLYGVLPLAALTGRQADPSRSGRHGTGPFRPAAATTTTWRARRASACAW